MFVAVRDISIFGRIDALVDEQIVIGGDRPGAVPEADFERLLKTFPTSTELRKYADARVATELDEYFDTMSDARQKLEQYQLRRKRTGDTIANRPSEGTRLSIELEHETLTYVHGELTGILDREESFNEDKWQEKVEHLFQLVFPQYVAVFHKVKVPNSYAQATKDTHCVIDILLVRADGCVDIIEIKKPDPHLLVTTRTYRNNHVSLRDLAGAIVQAEKYLFHLNKSGRKGEQQIQSKYKDLLPPGIEIKIINPKALILSGRDDNLTPQQKFDFEFIRRQHANVVDIITYDDLLRRLKNMIDSLGQRLAR